MPWGRAPYLPTLWVLPWHSPTTPAPCRASTRTRPFGAANETGPDANSFQYTGRENDVTGLYYHRARYYDPAIGSFISEDPVGFAGSGPNLMPTFTTVLQTQFDPFGLADSASPWQVGLEWLS